MTPPAPRRLRPATRLRHATLVLAALAPAPALAAQVTLDLHATGGMTTDVQAAATMDATHLCSLSAQPDGRQGYLLVYDKPLAATLLDPSRPGLVLTLADAHGDGRPSGQAGDTIQVAVGGHRFLGLGLSDPAFRLTVTLAPDGSGGVLSAAHLLDESGATAISLTASWRCVLPAGRARPNAPAPSVTVAGPAQPSATAAPGLPAAATPDVPRSPPAVTASPAAGPAATMPSTAMPPTPAPAITGSATTPVSPASPDAALPATSNLVPPAPVMSGPSSPASSLAPPSVAPPSAAPPPAAPPAAIGVVPPRTSADPAPDDSSMAGRPVPPAGSPLPPPTPLVPKGAPPVSTAVPRIGHFRIVSLATCGDEACLAEVTELDGGRSFEAEVDITPLHLAASLAAFARKGQIELLVSGELQRGPHGMALRALHLEGVTPHATAVPVPPPQAGPSTRARGHARPHVPPRHPAARPAPSLLERWLRL